LIAGIPKEFSSDHNVPVGSDTRQENGISIYIYIFLTWEFSLSVRNFRLP
jgi:hypothetical protein